MFMANRGLIGDGGCGLGPVDGAVSRGGVCPRLGLRCVFVLCAVLCGLLFAAAPALAAGLPLIEEESVLSVSGSSATLRASVNTQEKPTTYKFEYATSEAVLFAAKGEVIPAPPAEGTLDAGTTGVLVQAHPQDLQPATTYYLRVAAKNEAGSATGAVRSFTTQTVGGSLVLPDGRAWELVSPPPGDAGGTATITPSSLDGKIIQAAEDGGAFTFLTLGATEAAPAGDADESQVLSLRAPGGGWSSRDIAAPHELASGVSNSTGQEYRFFSPDLAVALVEPLGTGGTGTASAGATPLSPGASERTVYLHADQPLSPQTSEMSAYDEAEAEGGYKALVTSKPGYSNVPEGTKFAEEEEHPHFYGATPDMGHVIIRSNVPLTAATPEGQPTHGGAGLWEWTVGKEPKEQLQIVSVLPDGEQSPSSSVGLGTENNDNARGAISNDGSRIVWSARDQQGIVDVFVRDVSRDQTVLVDEIEEGAAGDNGGFENEAEFQFASSDGSRVLFTDEARLTTNSTASGRSNDLYECRIVEVEEAGKKVLRCKLTDLTVDPGGHAGVEGIVDVGSKEDTNLYFVATGKLTSKANSQGAEAKNNESNIYLSHFDSETGKWKEPVFIATLSARDGPDFVRGEGSRANLAGKTSRVSPNGEYLAFMSERPLTGYDNRDASSGEPDEELFLYDARLNRLVCVSCNPTGARPAGVLERGSEPPLLADPERLWLGGSLEETEHWLAASVPGWTNLEGTVARYQSRYLSDSGRLFFDSPDALVPQATNGLMDVYEYQPVGVGSCEASSSTYSERSGGCVGLISSGSSGEESAFLDASENGNDVFFLSSARLVGADTGSSLAVYDAHVCGAGEPCSTEAIAPPSCETADSCRNAPGLQPTIFGASGSATFSGAGNPTPASSPPAVKPKTKSAKCKKGFTKKKNRCVRKKAKRKAKRAKRASYDRRVK